MIDRKLIKETGDSQSFPIKGEMQSKKIYSIPLDQLKFNLKNGRIASYITEYQESHDDLPENYNDIIENFIVKSHLPSFRKTKENIKRFGQMEPAVALSDGTIVDGNRRFSALRQLAREGAGSRFGYIKAIILEQDSFTSKEIKTFELNLQHGREERVDYNPIEYLIDLYRDLLAYDAEFTPEEYAQETNKTVHAVKKDIRIAKLLVEYLEFINKPMQFHLARQSKLDGPLREVDNILGSRKIDRDMTPEIKDYLFTNILALDGDITRKIRDLRSTVEDKYKFEEAYDDLSGVMDEIYDVLHEDSNDSEVVEETTPRSTSEKEGKNKDDNTINLERPSHLIEIPREAKEEVKKITGEVIEADKIRQAKFKPIEIIQKSLNRLEEVDVEAVRRMSGSEKQDFMTYLDAMNQIITEMKGDIGVN